MNRVRIKKVIVATLLITNSMTHAMEIEVVSIGNPGNAPDHDYHTDPVLQGPNDGGRGAVAYRYEIGKYQVTNNEYAEFLNAVATTDTHSLYHASMNQFVRGGITRSGASGNYAYAARPNMGNKPVAHVSFWDAARFVNWLHNGQPMGAQDDTTTEDGVYTLGGVTDPDNLSVFRNVGARWFIPDENEWYKAAFHQPASEGGDGDDYWMFPTASNVQPIQATANAFGDVANPGSNVANYDRAANWNGATTGNLTTVGSAGPLSESYYGTADQAGNAWDWYETIVNVSINVEEDGRGIWGGSWDNSANNFRADHWVHHYVATQHQSNLGFRVARYAQPAAFSADFDLDDNVDANDLVASRLGWSVRFGVDLGGNDFLAWQRQLGSGDESPPAGALAVPEPSSILLFAAIMAVVMLVRFRHYG